MSERESEIVRERPTEETLVVCRYSSAWSVCSKKAKNARPARRVKGSNPDLKKKKIVNFYINFCKNFFPGLNCE